MISKGQIHAGTKFQEKAQSNIVLKNTLPSSLSSLIQLSFKEFENDLTNLALLAFYICETEMRVTV